MPVHSLYTNLLFLILRSDCLDLFFAEQKQQVGNFDIHYMALSSTFITPSIAKTYGIERSNYNGIVNIAVLDTSKEGNPPVAIEISGVANNLLDARISFCLLYTSPSPRD